MNRKKDHITLTKKSQSSDFAFTKDNRFNYEPILAAHPNHPNHPNQPNQPNQPNHSKLESKGQTISWGSFKLNNPLWISSMTGGTKEAITINQNLARACGEFGLGMGLGSSRVLLSMTKDGGKTISKELKKQFFLRPLIGDSSPFFTNLGIAQVEQLVREKKLKKILPSLVHLLEADGVIIHVNPLQEWFQPEGDRLQESPLTTIKRVIEMCPGMKIIVKEVGQGMGPLSLKALLELPLEAIEFGAYGGTNFSLIEQVRANKNKKEINPLTFVGHTAFEMVEFCNEIAAKTQNKNLCNALIISGGVKDALDGYALMKKAEMPSVYGIAARVLPYAKKSLEHTKLFFENEINNLAVAQSYLKSKL